MFDEFLWRVIDGGHKWIRARAAGESTKDRPRWMLTEDLPLGASFTATQYSPLREHTGLFRIFGETAPTREGILRFANQYGRLGEGADVFADLAAADDPKRLLGIAGEPYDEWRKQIVAMRQAVALWDKVRDGDITGLSRHIRWESDSVQYDSHPELPARRVPREGVRTKALIASKALYVEWLERFKPGDVVMPARFYIQRVVNAHLEGLISPRLLYDRERDRMVLHVVPKSLLGALWLQFAQAVSGKKRYRNCKECGRWYEISLQAARPNKLYCKNACRSKAYRERQERASRMHAEGKPPRIIAKELGSDVATVKKWITLRKG